MAFGNFSRDVQSKPEVPVRVVFVLVIGASLQRIKDLVEVQLLDDRTAIPDFEDNALAILIYAHIHRRIWRSILDRITHEVAE